MKFDVRTITLAFRGNGVWELKGNGLLTDGKYSVEEVKNTLQRLEQRGWVMMSSKQRASPNRSMRVLDLYLRHPLVSEVD